jgi:hypothetical protein
VSRRIAARLGKLEETAPKPVDVPMCVHHGPACELGARELSELYRLVIEAKQRQGQDVPPLDEHRAMTREERRQYDADYAEALGAAKERNRQVLAQMEAEDQARAVVEEAARRVQESP